MHFCSSHKRQEPWLGLLDLTDGGEANGDYDKGGEQGWHLLKNVRIN